MLGGDDADRREGSQRVCQRQRPGPLLPGPSQGWIVGCDGGGVQPRSVARSARVGGHRVENRRDQSPETKGIRFRRSGASRGLCKLSTGTRWRYGPPAEGRDLQAQSQYFGILLHAAFRPKVFLCPWYAVFAVLGEVVNISSCTGRRWTRRACTVHSCAVSFCGISARVPSAVVYCLSSESGRISAVVPRHRLQSWIRWVRCGLR
jgi:hypothetical protein